MNKNTQILVDYLLSKGVQYWEANGELITHCPINDCDHDSKGKEGHFYVSLQTTQYNCKKCGESGNFITLAEKFKDKGDSYLWDELQKDKKVITPRFATLVEKYHRALPLEVRQYLRDKRGWTDEIIDQQKIGWALIWGTHWVTFPIKNPEGKYYYFKLREDYRRAGKRRMTYPSEKGEAEIYDYDTLNLSGEKIVIVEGEGDALILKSKGIPAITNTHGAGTFKNDWLQYFPKDKTYYIAYDTDDAGIIGANKVASALYGYGVKKIYIINLPKRTNTVESPDLENTKVDITDYLMELSGTIEDLFDKYANEYPEKIDTSRFHPLTSEDISNILELTIKKDGINKVTTFLCQLSAYTEENQFNISFQAPSSSGKSHIPLEISNLFPPEDVLKLGNCSPTAFFHEQGVFNKETNAMKIDLERKILIFLDMPHTQLLEKLRPLLSHDEKEMVSKITDKSQRGGNKTKTVIIIGYPSVIFCSAGLNMDEQETTRFLLLSPETSQEKIREGVQQVIRKGVNKNKYNEILKNNIERQLLIERIRAIKYEKINDIQIESEEKIEKRYIKEKVLFKPKHQRDIKRLLSLVKAFTLLNLWWRKRDGDSVIADDSDIDEAFKLWDQISESQELNLPPYVFSLYKEVILALWNEKNSSKSSIMGENAKPSGLSRKEIIRKHSETYGRRLPTKQLADDILPLLEEAGLLFQEKDSNDQRMWLVYVIDESTIKIKEKVDEHEDQTLKANDDYNLF